jgi:hypothetical protein
LTRAGWEYAEKNRRPVFRYGDIAAVSWQGGGKWFGRLAAKGGAGIPLGPFGTPEEAMDATETAIQKAAEAQKQTDAKKEVTSGTHTPENAEVTK